jgi:hypothetical protein
MTFDLPNESCAGQREEVPDKGYSTGYFKYELHFTVYGEPGFCAFLRVRKPIIVRTP